MQRVVTARWSGKTFPRSNLQATTGLKGGTCANMSPRWQYMKGPEVATSVASSRSRERFSGSKLKVELSCDQTLLLPGIYPKELKTGFQIKFINGCLYSLTHKSQKMEVT